MLLNPDLEEMVRTCTEWIRAEIYGSEELIKKQKQTKKAPKNKSVCKQRWTFHVNDWEKCFEIDDQHICLHVHFICNDRALFGNLLIVYHKDYILLKRGNYISLNIFLNYSIRIITSDINLLFSSLWLSLVCMQMLLILIRCAFSSRQ